MVEIFEELDESELPLKRGFGGRGAWKVDEMKKELNKRVEKARHGGKMIFSVDVEAAWKAWHGGEPGKYAGYYLGRKIKDILDDMGVSGYEVFSRTVEGKKKVIINLVNAEF